MPRLLLVLFLVLPFWTGAAPADAAARAIWAASDGDKVDRDDRRHPARDGNSVWDGRRVRIFGARNEIIAVQVIVEADGNGITRLSAALRELKTAGGSRIVYRAPALDPTDSVDRPIALFVEHYMHVPVASHAGWVYAPGSPAAPRDPTGWKPVQLVPERARPDRGGLPIRVGPNENQAIWIEIYTGRHRPAGIYRGAVDVTADGRTAHVPIELELFDFALPDENSMHAMIYYESSQVELYQGRNLDAAYHRFAHRHRIELVHAYDEQSVQAAAGRFSGDDFTRARGYEGPGEGTGNVIVPLSFYGPGDAFDDRARAWRRADEWMTFLRARLPRALTFLYMPDEPRQPEYPRILTLADHVHSNPGPGRELPVFVTSRYVEALDGRSISGAPALKASTSNARRERARGRQFWFYNGGRPAGGAIVIDAPATDARAMMWAAFKHECRSISTGTQTTGATTAKTRERNQNVWAKHHVRQSRAAEQDGFVTSTVTASSSTPAREAAPDEDRAFPGRWPRSSSPTSPRAAGSSMLTIARRLGLTAAVDTALGTIVRECSGSWPVGPLSGTGDPYETMRSRSLVPSSPRQSRRAERRRCAFLAVISPALLAALVSRHSRRGTRRNRRSGSRPGEVRYAGGDRILSTLQVFPPDNPWNEVIAGRPLDRSPARSSQHRPDERLGFNLDMNFVIVPPDQPRVLRVLPYPDESDPGPFPIPDTAPIENWPLTHNEDAAALPKPGMTLSQFQREGSGDRHVIVVDPVNGRLHEFWQARRTDRGWEASQASTFDLTSNRLRPERWTSADAAGLPIFPAVVRFDEVSRGLVRHALRVTVRRTRREYVYPARHFASQLTDAALPRMGERLRLRRDFDVSTFPPHARAILRGLQQYGMFVADNGANWLVSIAPDRRIRGLDSLARVKGSDFEVVSTKKDGHAFQ